MSEAISEQPQTATSPADWLRSTRDAIAANGWHCIPVQDLTEIGKGAITPAKYADGQEYPGDHSLWRAPALRGDVFAVRLGRDAVLLDYDGNKPGTISEAELTALLGCSLPLPVQVRESDNSKHYLFSLPDSIDPATLKNSQDGKLAPGVDLKRGNQLIYIKRDKALTHGGTLPALAELPPAPGAVVEQLRKVVKGDRIQRVNKITGEIQTAEYSPADATSAYGAATLKGLCQQIRASKSGTHNATINECVLRAYHFVAGGEIAEADAERELLAAAYATGHAEDRILATFDSAREAGIREPMSAPESEASNSAAITADEVRSEAGLFNWQTIDITTPPGLAGEICAAITSIAHRRLPLSYVPAALQLVATAAGVGKRRGLGGEKLNLITLTLAPTAAGKEAGQEFIKRTLGEMRLARHVVGKPRTDKDMILNLLDTDAVALYAVDEAHAYMDSVNDSKSGEHKKALAGLMLEMATTGCYTLSGIHRRELVAQLQKDYARLEKRAEKLAEGDERAAAQLDDDRRELDKRRRWLDSGIPHPVANFMMSSTQDKFDKTVNYEDIESGLMGRSLVFRCPETREPLTCNAGSYSTIDPAISRIINALADIANPEKPRDLGVTAEARVMLEEVRTHFDQDELRNAPIIGGVYSRANERIRDLAAILALHTGIVEPAHVAYATAVFMRHVETCISLARQNNATSTGEIVQLRIVDRLRGKGRYPVSKLKQDVMRPRAMQEIAQRAKVTGAEPFEEALAALAKNGVITIEKAAVSLNK